MYISKIAKRGDFECFHQREMTNIWSEDYANYPNSIIIIHVLKYHIVSHKYVQLLCQSEINKTKKS